MSKPILIFDSGLGGLTIYQALQQAMPGFAYHYLADSARLPYGLLTEQALTEGCVALIETYVKQNQVQLAVIACNTASTAILDVLRNRLSIPIVGVVPAIKPAAELSASGCIALLATAATIQRPYTDELIEKFASHCRVQKIACPELVHMAEEKYRYGYADTIQLQRLLGEVDPLVDTLVLGCTHFPILQTEISACFSKKMRIVDSREAIVRRVRSLVGSQTEHPVSVYTDTSAVDSALFEKLVAKGFTKITSSFKAAPQKKREVGSLRAV
jgi:glutamate racemase